MMAEDLELHADVAHEYERWATLSEDGRYRYDLGRRWGSGGRRVAWVMLNPSTADAVRDDQTIRQCITYSQREGFDELVVVNLYAYRATDPRELGHVDDPVGPQNLSYLDHHTRNAGLVIAAWGAHPFATRIAPAMLPDVRLHCLGTTKGGHPRHPSRLAHTVELEVWR